MYIKTSHSKEVGMTTLVRAFVYSVAAPKVGFMTLLKDIFGPSLVLSLNAETTLTLIARNLPGKEPGQRVLIEKRWFKRFGKLFERLGYKAVSFDGFKQLTEEIVQKNTALVIVPEHYDSMPKRAMNVYEQSNCLKLVFQSRKKHRFTVLSHDFFIWQPKQLPRTVSGSLLVMNNSDLRKFGQQIADANRKLPRLTKKQFVTEIYRAVRRGEENRFRRIDRRPPAILSRMLCDFLEL